MYSVDDNLLSHQRLNNDNEKNKMDEVLLTNYDELVSNLND